MPFSESAKRFAEDTAEHQMTVLHEVGLYRHLRFQGPRTRTYWFELITWPGALTINGDMGTFTFARNEDMFTFFHTVSGINAEYWSQKVVADSGVKEYSEDVFKNIVKERVADLVAEMDDATRAEKNAFIDAVREDVLNDGDTDHEVGAHAALEAFAYDGFTFDMTSEWDLTDYTEQFLWCCHAICWGIAQYEQMA